MGHREPWGDIWDDLTLEPALATFSPKTPQTLAPGLANHWYNGGPYSKPCQTKSSGLDLRPAAHLQSHRLPGRQGQDVLPVPQTSLSHTPRPCHVLTGKTETQCMWKLGSQGSLTTCPSQAQGCQPRIQSQPHDWPHLNPHRSPAFSLGIITTQEAKCPQTLLWGLTMGTSTPSVISTLGWSLSLMAPELSALATGWPHYSLLCARPPTRHTVHSWEGQPGLAIGTA